MMIAHILMALTITLFLSGCSGLKTRPADTATTTPAPRPNTVESPAQIPDPAPPAQYVQPRLVQSAPPLQVADADERCLALNIYYEAGIEEELGKVAIAHVTINRLQTGRWGSRLCDVVYADAQFSWTGINKLKTPTGPTWQDSRKAAREAIRGLRVESLKKALYYHATYVKPYWRRAMTKIQRIGRHIFYAEAKMAQLAPPETTDPICALLLRSAAVEFDSCADAVRPAGP